MDVLVTQNWFLWGVAILLGMPVIVVMVGETIFVLEKRQSDFLGTVQNIRNFLLPSLFFFLLFSHVLEFEKQSITLRIMETVLYILSIHSTLKLINVLVFSDILPSDVQQRTPKLLIDFLRGFFVLLGAAFVFSYVWGADLGRLLAALGVGSVVLGLALQDVLGGLFSGLALLSSRPFVVGDWIRIDDLEGKVANIDWRAVTLQNRNGDLVIVPNSNIAKEQLFNFNRPSPVHREQVRFDIAFEHPPNQVRRILLEAVGATTGILKEPAASVILNAYGEFSVRYEVRYYIVNYEGQSKICSDFSSKVWYALRRHNIRYALREAQVGELPLAKTVEEIYRILHELSVFDVDKATLLDLAKHSHIEEFGESECILRKNEMPQTFSVIVSGKARETNNIRERESSFTENTLSRGDFFGISGIARREDVASGIYACTDLLVVAIDISHMRDMLYKNVQVAESLETVVKAREKAQLKLSKHSHEV